MAILVTSKQLTLQKLTQSLLTSRAGRTQLAEAVDAIRRANPGLAEGRIPRGTPIVIPPLKNERVDVSAVGRHVGSNLADPQHAVEELASLATENRDRVTERVKQAITELKQIGADRRIALTRAEASAIAKTLEEDVQRADSLATVWSDAAPAWQEELKGLEALVLRTRG